MHISSLVRQHYLVKIWMDTYPGHQENSEGLYRLYAVQSYQELEVELIQKLGTGNYSLCKFLLLG